jgi:hypothetical protein
MRETYQMQIMDSMIPNAEKTPWTHTSKLTVGLDTQRILYSPRNFWKRF